MWIAGCSLAVAVTAGLVERKQPLMLLRLSGMRLRDLCRVVFAEAAVPLLAVTVVSAALGLLVACLLITTASGQAPVLATGRVQLLGGARRRCGAGPAD